MFLDFEVGGRFFFSVKGSFLYSLGRVVSRALNGIRLILSCICREGRFSLVFGVLIGRLRVFVRVLYLVIYI